MDVVSYETIRRENIARNQRFLDEIGVTQLPNGAQTSTNFAEPDNVAEPDEMAQPSADQLRVEKETLEARWWARKNTLRTLLALLDVRAGIHPPLFVSGQRGTGKTALIGDILRTLHRRHVYINCIECHTPHGIFERVLNAVHGHKPTAVNKGANHTTCDNLPDFIQSLHDALPSDSPLPFYIVFDQADRLRQWNRFLAVILNLSELSQRAVTVILITHLTFASFRLDNGCRKPIPIVLRTYSQDVLRRILCETCATQTAVDNELLEQFVKIVLDVFFQATCDLAELQHITNKLFPIYIQPISDGQASSTDVHKLYQHVQPHFQTSLRELFLRVDSVQPLEQSPTERVSGRLSAVRSSTEDRAEPAGETARSNNNRQLAHEPETALPLTHTTVRPQSWRQPRPTARADALLVALSDARSHDASTDELPLSAKHVLLAAYLASYNPTGTDIRRFSITSAGGKAKKQRRSTIEYQPRLAQPRPFRIDRLIAMFNIIMDVILEIPEEVDNKVLQQVAQLRAMNLIVAANDSLETQWLVTNISHAYAEALAANCHFPMVDYLHS